MLIIAVTIIAIRYYRLSAISLQQIPAGVYPVSAQAD